MSHLRVNMLRRVLRRVWVLLLPIATAAQAPSQLELNGFLLGQRSEAFAAQLGKAAQEEVTGDKWTYRVYIVDRPHRAYMAVKFAPDRPDHAVSIQVAGDSGASVLPFLGVSLGADTAVVRARIGAPSAVERSAEPTLVVWHYADRNYSFEFTTAGRLFSIQLFGYDGFPPQLSTAVATLVPLREALNSQSALDLLAVLAPDAEVYRGEATHTIDGGVRHVLEDSTSALRRQLLDGPASLRAVLANEAIVAAATTSIRILTDGRRGAIYSVIKFPANSQLEELVFEGFAGSWRVWEIQFR